MLSLLQRTPGGLPLVACFPDSDLLKDKDHAGHEMRVELTWRQGHHDTSTLE